MTQNGLHDQHRSTALCLSEMDILLCSALPRPLFHRTLTELTPWIWIKNLGARGEKFTKVQRVDWQILFFVVVVFFYPNSENMRSETDLTHEKCNFSGWSFARGRPLQIISCQRPAPPDYHLQEAGGSGWSFATMKRACKMHIWNPSKWNKMCFEYQRIKFQWKKWVKIFIFSYGQDRRGYPPSPLP